MKYDDASWHYGGNFPENLPPEAGATHIGMFVAWSLLNGLAGEIHTTDFPNALDKLKRREMTPGRWFLTNCDEKFTDEDLNSTGNEFAVAYYDARNGKPSLYFSDYETAFPDFPDVYSVADTWANYERLAPYISARFEKFRRRDEPWWRRLIASMKDTPDAQQR